MRPAACRCPAPVCAAAGPARGLSTAGGCPHRRPSPVWGTTLGVPHPGRTPRGAPCPDGTGGREGEGGSLASPRLVRGSRTRGWPRGERGNGPILGALSAASLRKGTSVFSFAVHGVRIGVKRKGFSLQKVDTGVGNFGVVAFSLRWRQDSNGGMSLELGVSACLGMQDQPPLLETSGRN